uniref:protein AHNAK2 n=1 Tax=Jaculus jaculus TaxID=51337 RepID=UPI001E1AFE58|nr:protein AHNAK2 [Jaculus jaculus]
MCDCFHVVLPTWSGAPGGVSGRQLQSQEPEAETEEDCSVTEGPAGEIIRPRPQGSSPVYECTAEGSGFGSQADSPARRSSSSRRRSWWKRDSGDSVAFSSMSHSESVQEVTEVTLKTEVEAGASGYSVTGGGNQGIFVKQVLKDSSAAKLFNLREGDQLLSATIFFDHIKYEDALKILQYSEPYKIQFQIKRKLPASEEEEWAIWNPQQGPKGQEKQDKDVADGCMETPTKTLEADGDQERLISKPREGRGRRPQDRLSWPKFQAIQSKRAPGPRRSHSSSEASEGRDVPYLSSTSTDSDAQMQAERRDQKAGPDSQRKRFLNLRFGIGSGQATTTTGRSNKEAQGRQGPAGVLEESLLGEDSTRDVAETVSDRNKDSTQEPRAMLDLNMPRTMEPSLPELGQGAPGEGLSRAERHQRKTRNTKTIEEGRTHSQSRGGTTPSMRGEAEWEGVQSLEIGISQLTLGDKQEEDVEVDIQAPSAKMEGDMTLPDKDVASKDSKFKMPKFKMPSFGVSAPGKSLEASLDVAAPKVEAEVARPKTTGELKAPDLSIELPSADVKVKAGHVGVKLPEGELPMQEAGASLKGHMPSVQMPSLKMPKVDLKGPQVDLKSSMMDLKGPGGEVSTPDLQVSVPCTEVIQAPCAKLERDMALPDKDVAPNSKFKMPKFKMPSFGVSATGKFLEASLEVVAPKVEEEVALSTTPGELKAPDLSTELPYADMKVKASQVGVKLPEGELPEQAAGAILKRHLPRVQMPGLMMPKEDLKGTKEELKNPQSEVSTPNLEVSVPCAEVDIQAPSAKQEGDMALLDKDVANKHSKFKMPKIKMPSFGMFAPGKSLETSMEVAMPKVNIEVALSAFPGELKTPDLRIELPSADVQVKASQVGMKLPEEPLSMGELPAQVARAGLKGHLAKVQMPSVKMPKVDLKGPQVDMKEAMEESKGPQGKVNFPNLEVSVPCVEVDIQAPGAKLEGDVALPDKDVDAKDSKFKMTKFKIPSFGMSTHGKSLEASLEEATPKVDVDVALPATQGELKTPELSIELPSADVEIKDSQVGVKMPESPLAEGKLPTQVARASLKGHLPRVQMPSLKMPKVDLKGLHMDQEDARADLKGPRDELGAPDIEVSVLGVEVDIQAPSAKLEGDMALPDKDMANKDSKFKMPSFGVSVPGKSLEASLEMAMPKVEADEALPAAQGKMKAPDLSIELPSTDVKVKAGHVGMKLPKGEPPAQEAGFDLTGHLHTLQMPSLKMPKVDLKGPQVDLKESKVDLKGPRSKISFPDLEVSVPCAEVDIQAPSAKLEGDVALSDKDVDAKDSKFKMPKYKVPSFSVLAPSKSLETLLEVGAPKVEAEVALPAATGKLKTPDLSIELPSADVKVKAGHVGMKLPEGELPMQEAGVELTGHLHTLQMPSLKMPKVDLKGPQVHLKESKVDLKGPQGKMSFPDLEVSVPCAEVDIQAPSAKLEGDKALPDKDVDSKDSKFKMPKFKMPSFGMLAPGKSLEASLEVGAPKVEVALPAATGELKTPDLSIELPSAEVEVKAGQVGMKLPEEPLPEAQLPVEVAISSLKGHLPRVQVPSLKMPKVDLKGPQVDLKGSKVELKGPQGEMSVPDLEMSVVGAEVDIQAPSAKLEGDVAFSDKDVTVKESKFKMPKFKMPTFEVSAPGKSLEASLEGVAPKVEAEVAQPAAPGKLKTPDLSIELPSADVEVKAGQLVMKLPEEPLPMGKLPVQKAGAGLKEHLPSLQMPSLKMPKVDLQGPQVDLKGPQGKVSFPDLEVSMPCSKVDIQNPGAKLEEDMSLPDKDVASKDSKFKMPKFKMPSFGVSAPGKSLEASLEVWAPKLEAEVALPAAPGELKTPDLSIELPSTDVEVKAGQVGVKLPEELLPMGELPIQAAGVGLKGPLPRVQMPSLKMPKVDLKGPQLDLKGAKADLNGPRGKLSVPDLKVSVPCTEVGIQAPGAKLEGDVALAEKDVAAKDSKFKKPEFKMPSFDVLPPGKSLEDSLEVAAPKVKAEMALPTAPGELKTPDLSIELPSMDVEVKASQVGVKLPAQEARAGLKGHLPSLQMPSLKMSKVDLKGPKVELKGTWGELSTLDLEVSVPGTEVDIQAPSAKLKGDLALPDKVVDTKDSKFKMPSFGLSAPGKSLEDSLEVAGPKLEAEVALPTAPGEQKIPDFSIELPSTDVEVKAGQLVMELLEEPLPMGELPMLEAGANLKGHLPRVQMPSLKMPKVDLKGPQVDLKGSEAELKGPRSELSALDLEVSVPCAEEDIQAPGAKLEGDMALPDKDVAAKDSKFKMPSFGVSALGKSLEASLDVAAPKVEADMARPDTTSELKAPDLSIELSSMGVKAKAGLVGMKLPEGKLPAQEARAGLKGHLPSLQMPSFKMPKVDLKGPKAELKGTRGELSAPDLEVSVPGTEVDIQAPGAKLMGDLALPDKDVASKDSKFKMPRFKMPSFGVSTTVKFLEASLEVATPKVEAEVDLPAVPGELKTPDLSIELPSTDVEVKAGQVGVKLPEEPLPEAKLPVQAAVSSLQGHLPRVQMPSLKMPKVDRKGPHVDLKGAKEELKGRKGDLSAPDQEMSVPCAEVDIQAPSAKLEGDMALPDKDVATKDSKFKMPKFKMPSFNMSSTGKSLEASLEVVAPKVEAEVELPTTPGELKAPDLSIELSSSDMKVKPGHVGVKLPECKLPGQEARASHKGHLPSVQMPKVDLKGPQVCLKGDKVELKGPRGKVSTLDLEVSVPCAEGDIQTPGGKLERDVALPEKDVATIDSKFEMPSFGMSATVKSLEASLEVATPKVDAEVALPIALGELKTPDLSIELPSTDVEVKAGQVGMKLPEEPLPEAELPMRAAISSFKGHLPRVQMRSLKMPKVDLKGPHVDLKGAKEELKVRKGEVSAPNLEVPVPCAEVDIQAPSAKLEGDMALPDKDVVTKDSKFKMPKFKMPSFGVLAPGKSLEASLEVAAPNIDSEVALPTVAGELKTPDLSIERPSTDVEVKAGQVGMKLPEGLAPKRELPSQPARASVKGHMPRVQTPSFKIPKVDLKGSHVDLKGGKAELKGPQHQVSAPNLEVSVPCVVVDIQAPGAKLEGDVALPDKDVAAKDSKFKMPKIKMPSFGMSAPVKSLEASLEVMVPNVEEAAPGEMKAPDLSIELPSTDMKVKAGQVDVKLPKGKLPTQEARNGHKGHLPSVQKPSLKMPKVDLKGPQVDLKGGKAELKGPQGEVNAPDLEVSVPCAEVDIQAPDAKLEGDVALPDKDVTAKDSKFKMPKFKMPSFGTSAPVKSLEASLEVVMPKVEAEVALPIALGELKAPDLSIELLSADMGVKAGQVGVKLPEVPLPEGDMPTQTARAGLKGLLPKVQMPSLKMPKVDLKGPQVDLKCGKAELKSPQGKVNAPDLEVSVPCAEVDIQAPGAKLEGDVALPDKDVDSKDSKFKMPKFKMPSFSVSTTVKSLEVVAPKVDEEVALPTVPGELKTPDLSIELPSTDVEVKAGQVGMKLPEEPLPEAQLPVQVAVPSLKGHLPRVQMPSLKMPKVDLKGTHVDLKGAKEELKGRKGEVSAPDLEVSVPCAEVDIQAPSAKLEGDLALPDKDVASKDSKFKVPKFKIPSFGGSAPGKSLEASLDVSVPKVEAEVSLPVALGELKAPDLSIELPSAAVKVKPGQVVMKLPEGKLHAQELRADHKGHLPSVQMPSLKMPKVDLKGPQVDLKGGKEELKGPQSQVSAPDLEVCVPCVEEDIQAPGAKLVGDLVLPDKDVAAKDSKFKMPKFKMPSFGVSAPGKTLDASLEVETPKVEAGVALPMDPGELKTPDLSIKLPSADMKVKTSQVGVKLPKGELPTQEARAGHKGQLPSVQMPSLKMPKVDLKGPHLDLKGGKEELKGRKGEVSAPDLEVSVPCAEVDIQAPSAKLEGDVAMPDKNVASKDSKFKIPKFKMPSFGGSAPGKSLEASLDVSVLKVEAEVALPVAPGELKAPDLSIELPSAAVKVKPGQVVMKLPEGKLHAQEPRAGLKGHLPSVQMPSLKMPKVDLKGPQVDLKGGKEELKGLQSQVSAPDLEVCVPCVEEDIQAPGAKLVGDLVLPDKDVAAKDSKFKMPKFKMPSFGVSAPVKTLDTSLEVETPKVEAGVALPIDPGELKAPDLSIELPSADMKVKTSQMGVKLPKGELSTQKARAGHKGQLPSVQMPSLKMPKVDLKGPHVDLKGGKEELKGHKGEVSAPDLEVSVPCAEVDIQAPSAKLEGDVALPDKDVASKDSKFKVPKFKMPSFGGSAPGKSLEASLDVSVPKVEAEVALPVAPGELKAPDLSIELPSAAVKVKPGQVVMKLPEGKLHAQEPRAGLKGHLPSVQMPSLKMPKLDLKGLQVDLKGGKEELKGPQSQVSAPDLEVCVPCAEEDIQAPGAKLVGDVAAKDSKFKMPKFKMSSFGVSAPGKTLDASLEVETPKVEAGVALPIDPGELKAPDLSIELPSADMKVKTGQMGVKLPKGELSTQEARAGHKGQLPSVQMPSLKMPKVDLKGSHLDLKGGKEELKGRKGEVSAPDLEVSVPCAEVDIQAPSAKLEGDVALPDKDVASKDSKFKVPKFKMPSFSGSAPAKSLEALLDVSVPKVEAEVALPVAPGKLKAPDLSIELPSAAVKVKPGQVVMKLPEGELPVQEARVGLKGQLPSVQMPSLKTPKVDLEDPQVDLKGGKEELKGLQSQASAPDLDVSVPCAEVDIQAPGAKLVGDVVLPDKDMAAKDSKFKMSKFKMPSFGMSAPGKSLEASLEVAVPKVEAEVALPASPGELKTPDRSIEYLSSDMGVKSGHVGIKLPEGPLAEGEPLAQAARTDLKGHLPRVQTPSLKMQKVDLKGSPLNLNVTPVILKLPDDAVILPSLGASQFQSGSDIFYPSVSYYNADEVSSLFTSGSAIPVDFPSPSSPGHVTFPKFHKPKFVFSDPVSSFSSCDIGFTSQEPILSPVSNLAGSTCGTAHVSSDPESQTSYSQSSASPVVNESSTWPSIEPPSENSVSEGKGSSFNLPRFNLHPLSWSPRKEAEFIPEFPGHSEDCTPCLSLAPDQMDMQPGTGESQLDAQVQMHTEMDAGKGRSRKPSFSLPRLSLPKLNASKGKAVLPVGDEHATGGYDCQAPQPSHTDGSARIPEAIESTPDVELTGLHLTQVPIPSNHFAKPHLRTSLARGEVTQSKADLPLHKHDSQGPELRGVSGNYPYSEETAPTMEDHLKLSCRRPDNACTMESPEKAPIVEEMATDFNERWFKMPKFHVPGFRHSSSKERDGAQEQGTGEMHMPLANVPSEVDSAACVQLSHVPGLKVEAQVSLQHPEERGNLGVLESPTYADVVKCDLHSTGSRLHRPTVSMSRVYLPIPELTALPAEGSLPLEMPAVQLSEPQASPQGTSEQPQCGSRGYGLAELEEGAETWPAQPEGPLRLKASCTNMPAQVSVVRTSQFWEDAVLTVTFPKLKVPTFSFPHSLSSEAVFFPVVREVQCAQANVGTTLCEDSLGLWGASLLKAGTGDPGGKPMGLDESLEASSVSKVRVHIQGSQDENRQVTVCSAVAQEGVDPTAPEAFSTHIVRESEIPTSMIQTPSYGFSLLKVKIPEPPAQATVCTIASEPPEQEDFDGAPKLAASGVHSVPGALQPDAGESFEMISTRISLSQQQTLEVEVPSGCQPADSGSDEEPAEILEFPDDSQEVRAPWGKDRAVKEKSEGKKSGLLWSWLPSIGFSSVEETCVESTDTTQRSTPVHMKPGAPPDPELPKKQEKASWFRFPKLGFSSSPTEKGRSSEDNESQASQKLQEETVTFFDARESFSPEEEEEEEGIPGVASAEPGSRAMVASSVRTELVLLEERNTCEKSMPGPMAK